MRSKAALLIPLGALVGVGAYFFFNSLGAGTPESGATLSARGPGAKRSLPSEGGELESQSRAKDAKREGSAGGDKRDATHARTPGSDRMAPSPALRPEIRALAYAPTATLAKQFGWSLQDPRSAFLARWHRETRTRVCELSDEISNTAHAAQAPLREAFNAKVDAWRTRLVVELGERDARQVLDKYPLYRFDLENPKAGWCRVDVRGRRVPFKHDDEQRWDGYELRDA